MASVFIDRGRKPKHTEPSPLLASTYARYETNGSTVADAASEMRLPYATVYKRLRRHESMLGIVRPKRRPRKPFKFPQLSACGNNH